MLTLEHCYNQGKIWLEVIQGRRLLNISALKCGVYSRAVFNQVNTVTFHSHLPSGQGIRQVVTQLDH